MLIVNSEVKKKLKEIRRKVLEASGSVEIARERESRDQRGKDIQGKRE